MVKCGGFASVHLTCFVCDLSDWILPVDGDELSVRCRYCSRVLNARYLQLLRHSLSNRHLSSAASAATLSLPMDVDSCVAPEGLTVHADLSEDGQMITNVEDRDVRHVFAAEAGDVELKLSDVKHLFVDPTTVSFVAGSVDEQKKVGIVAVMFLMSS